MALTFLILGAAAAMSLSEPQRIEARGDHHGHVELLAEGGAVVAAFDLGDRVVRDTFVLEGGEVVAATVLGRSIFWDVSLGKRSAELDAQILAFSGDQERFVAFRRVERNADPELFVGRYPSLVPELALEAPFYFGPMRVQWSPDGRFVLVQLHSYYPLSDEAIREGPIFDKSIYKVLLYDLEGDGAPLSALGDRQDGQLGRFTADSWFYEFPGERIRFDLVNQSWRKLARGVEGLN